MKFDAYKVKVSCDLDHICDKGHAFCKDNLCEKVQYIAQRPGYPKLNSIRIEYGTMKCNWEDGDTSKLHEYSFGNTRGEAISNYIETFMEEK